MSSSLLRLALLLSALAASGVGRGQINTLYNVPTVPQSTFTNPAFQHSCKFFLGLPGLSQTGFDIRLPFTIDDVLLRQGTGLAFDLERLASGMDRVNELGARVNTDLLSLGIRSRKGFYYTFNLSLNADVALDIPRGLVELPLHGNWDYTEGENHGSPRPIDLGGLGIHSTVYTQASFGMSAQVNRRLNVGGRVRVNLGSTNITTSRSELLIETDPTTFFWNMDNSRMTVDASLPLGELPRDAEGALLLDSLDLGQALYGGLDGLSPAEATKETLNKYLLTGNYGLSFDLGASYQLSDALSVSAAVLNLGFIRWKTDAYRLEGSAQGQIEGIDLTPFLQEQILGDGNAADSVVRQLENLADELVDNLSFSDQERRYTTFTPTQVMLGANYHFSRKVNAGLLLRNEILRGKVDPSLTLSANFNFFKAWTAGLTYTLFNQSRFDLGLALVMKYGPMQIFVLSDNLPFTFARTRFAGEVYGLALGDIGQSLEGALGSDQLLLPYQSRLFNLRFGINFLFGCKDKVDRPSFNNSALF